MTEEEARVLKAQMIDLNSRVNKVDPFRWFKDNWLKIIWVIFLITSVLSIHIRLTQLEKHITASSIKNANSIKKQMRVYYE